jgi:hypothetical protein
MCAMLIAAVFEFTRPTNSSMFLACCRRLQSEWVRQ